jgi:serine protease Do
MHQRLSAARPGAFVAVAVAATLAGCASGYSTYYRPAQGASAELSAQQRAASPTEPLVERLALSAEPQQLFEAYEKRGYVLIGSSAFNSDQRESETAAIAQARKVGAELVVIVNPRHTGSTTRSVPLRVQASDRNTPVASFGTGNDVTFREIDRPRTYGTQAVNVAMTVHHTDFGAGYFVKQR